MKHFVYVLENILPQSTHLGINLTSILQIRYVNHYRNIKIENKIEVNMKLFLKQRKGLTDEL